MNDRYSKLAFLHRVKERKTPSLSAQGSFAPFSLKVVLSGKSLIGSNFEVMQICDSCHIRWQVGDCICRTFTSLLI